jgi:hypothetical protein
MRHGPVRTWSAQALHCTKRVFAEINGSHNVAAKQPRYDN